MVESEKTAKWQYTRHCEDLSVEIKKLREEVNQIFFFIDFAYLNLILLSVYFILLFDMSKHKRNN